MRTAVGAFRRAWRRAAGVATVAVCVLSAYGAAAACGGKSLIPALQTDDPEGLSQLFKISAQVPNAEGKFWRVSRAGVADSHMFGTFHSQEAVSTVEPHVWATLISSRAAVFEVTRAEQKRMEARMSTDPLFVFDPDAPPLSSGLTPSQVGVLREALSARGMELSAVEQMRPWLLATFLGFPPCQLRSMMTGQPTLDGEMARRATGAGVAELGLETYEASIAGFGRIESSQLIDALISAPPDEHFEEDVFRTLADLYDDGKIWAINELSIYLAERHRPEIDARGLNRSLMAELLDRRNLAWMQMLNSELSKGNAFIAVGALHLPGNLGLVRLLRQDGWTVTRLD